MSETNMLWLVIYSVDDCYRNLPSISRSIHALPMGKMEKGD